MQQKQKKRGRSNRNRRDRPERAYVRPTCGGIACWLGSRYVVQWARHGVSTPFTYSTDASAKSALSVDYLALDTKRTKNSAARPFLLFVVTCTSRDHREGLPRGLSCWNVWTTVIREVSLPEAALRPPILQATFRLRPSTKSWHARRGEARQPGLSCFSTAKSHHKPARRRQQGTRQVGAKPKPNEQRRAQPTHLAASNNDVAQETGQR